jgi:superfamily I DNA/RNA helicase
MTDLDLDALERSDFALIDIEGEPPMLSGPRPALELLTFCLPALIQRLRELEAERDAYRENADTVTDELVMARDRIAQLERVREAAGSYVTDYHDAIGLDHLQVALDAADEK